MAWTDEDEASFNKALKLRDQYKNEIGKKQMVSGLRQLADSIENGSVGQQSNVDINFLTRDVYGYPHAVPYAKQLTITIPLGE